MNNFNIQSLTAEQKKTRKRILEISHEENLSHLGSCLGSIDLIDAIYKVKNKDEKFILSCGHAGIALYVILEKNGFIKSSDIKPLHVHPDRNPKLGIDVSTGSLGQGLPIALGMAISDKSKNVYCLISDGECAEGSIWETLRIAKENNATNLKIMVNANGWSAYDAVNLNSLINKFKGFGYRVLEINGHDINTIVEALKSTKEKDQAIIFARTSTNQLPFLKGLDAHYYIMNDQDYKQAFRFTKMKNLDIKYRHNSMRGWFAYELYKQMAKDERIWLIVGDLGYKAFDYIRRDFPERFVNCGAAEQAMTGIATGIALNGKIPFVYSITTFLLYRPFETIRNYINHEKIPVKLIGGGRNKDYTHDGFSHWAEEDKDVLKIFKNIEARWPKTKEEMPTLVKEMLKSQKPWYVNLKRD